MKSAFSYIRVILFLILSFLIMEWVVESGNQLAIQKYPIIWGVLALIAFLAIAFEVIIATVNRVLFKTLDTDAQARYLAKQKKFDLMAWYQKMMAAKPMEKEKDIVLDHDYDGIRELDNVLPPWWVYMFYATIIFAVVYLVQIGRAHV